MLTTYWGRRGVAVRNLFFVFCTASLLSSCVSSSTVVEPSAPSTGSITVISFEVLPEGTLTKDSFIRARIEYTIDNFRDWRSYRIAPFFGDARGEGFTFNAQPGQQFIQEVDRASGIIDINYPIRRELTDRRLARPARVWFHLLEDVGKGRSRIVAKAGSYRLENSDQLR
jgi:hypothetical protein